MSENSSVIKAQNIALLALGYVLFILVPILVDADSRPAMVRLSTPTPHILPIECDPQPCSCIVIPEQCQLGTPPCMHHICEIQDGLMQINCNGICAGIQASLMAQCRSNSNQICYDGYCVDTTCPTGTHRKCEPWKRNPPGVTGSCASSNTPCSLDCVCDGVQWRCVNNSDGHESTPTVFPTTNFNPLTPVPTPIYSPTINPSPTPFSTVTPIQTPTVEPESQPTRAPVFLRQ